MNAPLLMRLALTVTAILASGRAQAGQDVPPPRAIVPVQSVLVAASPLWPADRYIPVGGGERVNDCGARAHDEASDDRWIDDWADEPAEYAGFDDHLTAGWEAMQ